MASVKSSSKSSKSSSKSSKNEKVQKVKNILPEGCVAEFKVIDWEKAGTYPNSMVTFKDAEGDRCEHSSVTGFFENKFSPFTSAKIVKDGKTTVTEEKRRLNMNQYLDPSEKESQKLIETINGYDAITEANQVLFMGDKLAGHYTLKKSVRTSTPKFDPKKPDKDLTPKFYVKYWLDNRNEFSYEGEILDGENVTNIYKSRGDYNKSYRETDKDKTKFNKLKITLKLKEREETNDFVEKEVYLKDIVERKKLNTVIFYREKHISKVPKDENGNPLTPNKCIEIGGTKKLNEVYGDVSKSGKSIGYAPDLDEYLDTSKGRLFIRYQYRLAKCDVGKNPNAPQEYENCLVLTKIDVIKILTDGFSSKYNNSYTSFMTPEEIKAQEKEDEENEKVEESQDNTSNKSNKNSKSKSSDNDSYKKALLKSSQTKDASDTEDEKDDGSDSDSDDSEDEKDNDSDSDNSEDENDDVVPEDSDNIKNIKESISDSESEANDSGDDNSDSDSDSDDSVDSEAEREAARLKEEEEKKRRKAEAKAAKEGKKDKDKSSKKKNK